MNGRWVRAQRIIFALCFLTAVWELVHVLLGPLSLIVQYVADDSFYYLEIARNLARLGISTFDGGLTRTTGYHPLWAWALELIAHIVRSDRMDMLRGIVLVSGAVALLTALAAAVGAWKRSSILLAIISFQITSMSFLCNSVAGVEWSFTLAISTAVAYLLIAPSKRNSSSLVLLGLFLLGVLGSLARSDFGGQTVCYAAGAVLVFFVRAEKKYLLPSLSTLAGACTGLILLSWRNYVLTGSLIQGSARMKELWARAGGDSPIPFFPVLLRTVFYIPIRKPKLIPGLVASMHGGHSQGHELLFLLAGVAAIVAFAVAILGWILFCLKRRDQTSAPPALYVFLLSSAGLTLVLYACVYAFNSFSLQIWYSQQITVAVVVMLFFMAKKIAADGHQTLVFRILALFTAINVLAFAVSPPKFSQQKSILEEAAVIRQSIGHQRIGIADSGIFNFVWGGDVINLDGLMNDEIFQYAPDRLPCYLLDKNIRYFGNFGTPAELTFNLRPHTDYAEAHIFPLSGGNSVTLYELNVAETRALPECSRHL